MIYERDWFMRQIQLMVQVVSRLCWGKDFINFNVLDMEDEERGKLYHERLLSLIAQNKFNEAENLLFEELRPGNLDDLQIALDFYNRLNALTDEDLIAAQFSRQEVLDGLQEVVDMYGFEI